MITPALNKGCLESSGGTIHASTVSEMDPIGAGGPLAPPASIPPFHSIRAVCTPAALRSIVVLFVAWLRVPAVQSRVKCIAGRRGLFLWHMSPRRRADSFLTPCMWHCTWHRCKFPVYSRTLARVTFAYSIRTCEWNVPARGLRVPYAPAPAYAHCAPSLVVQARGTMHCCVALQCNVRNSLCKNSALAPALTQLMVYTVHLWMCFEKFSTSVCSFTACQWVLCRVRARSLCTTCSRRYSDQWGEV